MKTLVLFAALAAIATPAAAQSNPGLPAIVVKFNDLDLTRPAGADVLIARIEHAANQVCGSDNGARSLTEVALHRDCMKQTMAAAIRSVNAPLVTARFGGAPANPELAAK